MRSLAIVIGIDRYRNADFNLTGAVADALAFRDWALGPGGVAEADLRLFLSPLHDRVTPLQAKAPTRRDIGLELDALVNGGGEAFDRLYFYFAGHGLSAAAAQVLGDADPLVLPADVADLVADRNLSYRLSEICLPLSGVAPAEQFFFIDACRDFAVGKLPFGCQSVPYPARVATHTQSGQYMLHATGVGQRAFEEAALGHGRFTRYLIDELHGRGRSKVWSAADQRYDVRFARVCEVVSARVVDTARSVRPQDWQRQVQRPECSVSAAHQDPVLVSFTAEAVGEVPLRVRIQPAPARQSGRVWVEFYSPHFQRYVTLKSMPPPAPLALPCRFDLPPGKYTVSAAAPGFTGQSQTMDLWAADEIDWQLAPTTAPLAQPAPVPASAPAPAPAGAGTAPPQQAQGQLCVSTNDQSVAVLVRNAQGLAATDRRQLALQSHYGSFSAPLDAGYYFVSLALPGEPLREQLVEVRPGEQTRVALDAPPARLGTRVEDALRQRGMVASHGYLHVSEALSGLARPSLATILALMAFRAVSVQAGMFRLESLGLEPFGDLPADTGGFLALLGVAGPRVAPRLRTGRFLRDARLVLRQVDGAGIHEGRCTPIAGLEGAAQWRAVLPPGSQVIELQLPGFLGTSYAVATLPGRITVLVLAIEADGALSIQQYLLPGRHGEAPFTDFLGLARAPGANAAVNMQRLERAQRYYLAGEAIPSEHLLDLLYGKWLDPMLGCVAGYALWQGRGTAPRGAGFKSIAMENMLRHFGGLADSHVLAALHDPAHRDRHFAEAARIGLPVFAAGYRALRDWHSERHPGLPTALALPAKHTLLASPWTTWTTGCAQAVQ